MTVAAQRIRELHDVRDTDKLQSLVSSMSTDGWVGRPVLVIDETDIYQAVTGSHRIAAARIADIDIPVEVITQDQITPEFADDFAFCTDDWDRQKTLADHGLVTAAELMQAEIDANETEQ